MIDPVNPSVSVNPVNPGIGVAKSAKEPIAVKMSRRVSRIWIWVVRLILLFMLNEESMST